MRRQNSREKNNSYLADSLIKNKCSAEKTAVKKENENSEGDIKLLLKIKNYIKAESLEQAYELNQKRTACVLGGMVWLKMGNRNIMTAN